MIDQPTDPYLDGLPPKVWWECRRRRHLISQSKPWFDANLELVEYETDALERIGPARFRAYVVCMIGLCRRASSLWLWRAAQFEAMLHAIDHPEDPSSHHPIRPF